MRPVAASGRTRGSAGSSHTRAATVESFPGEPARAHAGKSRAERVRPRSGLVGAAPSSERTRATAARARGSPRTEEAGNRDYRRHTSDGKPRVEFSSFPPLSEPKRRNCRDRANIGEDRSGRKIPRPQNREDQVVGNPLRGFTGPRLERERRPVCPEIGPAGAAQPEMPPKPSSFRFRELPRKKTVDEVDHFAAGQQHLQRRAPRGESIGSWMPQARPRFRVISRPSGNARQGLRAGPAGPGAAGF
jgi:hypothetical protein